MEVIHFKWCIIGENFIVIHTKDEDISYRPAWDLLIVNGTIIVNGAKADISGEQIITHLYFERKYVKSLDFVPEEKCIKYTLFRKKPYVKGWVQDSKPRKFSRTFINYTIDIE